MAISYDPTEFLEMYYHESAIPCYLCQGDRIILAIPRQGALTFPPDEYRRKLIAQTQRIAFCSTEYGLYYTRLTLDGPDDTSILFGPVGAIPHTEMDFRCLLADYMVPLGEMAPFQTFMRRIPDFSLAALLRKMIFLNYCLNGESLQIDSFFPMEAEERSEKSYERAIEDREDQHHNHSYELETQMYGYVRDGNVAALRSMDINDSTLNAGTLAHTPLRHLQNLLIVSTTLFTRAAIEGGLDTDTAYQISDEFIQASERAKSSDSIEQLMDRVPCTFAKLVADAKAPVSSNETIQKAIRYIQQNITNPISAADVAEHVNVSRSYFSTCFKEELGFSISEYILRCRLEEAKSLLAHTSRPLSQISNYLCFSS